MQAAFRLHPPLFYKREFFLRPVIHRLAFALAACALGILPVACASGGSTVPSAVDGTRSTSSGGPANTGGGGGAPAPAPVTAPGGGGGKAVVLLPGAMAFSSGCGAINSVSSSASVNAGFVTDTITTKVAETNCVNVYFSVNYVNTSTGRTEFSAYCFNFSKNPYTCTMKDADAKPDTIYQTVVTVWDATNAAGPGTPIDPAWLLATETMTFSTVGAAPNQGA